MLLAVRKCRKLASCRLTMRLCAGRKSIRAVEQSAAITWHAILFCRRARFAEESSSITMLFHSRKKIVTCKRGFSERSPQSQHTLWQWHDRDCCQICTVSVDFLQAYYVSLWCQDLLQEHFCSERPVQSLSRNLQQPKLVRSTHAMPHILCLGSRRPTA